MPSAHFSNFISQRGSIIQLLPAGIEEGAPIDGLLMPGIIVPRSIIIALDMKKLLFMGRTACRSLARSAGWRGAKNSLGSYRESTAWGCPVCSATENKKNASRVRVGSRPHCRPM